ncbi:hypothetical protein WA026_017198 [Henosepilachna vigintioctopunctata]|uniref:Uncharacterized protein n=1 Tax=Henosepilachna vigintioctopunctata TaxID=420089 RepID=A0AAW1UDD6_9CUCU
MRTKNFIFILCSVIIVSFVLIAFGQNKPEAIQNIVSTTHQQFRNFQDNLRDAESKTLVADEKYLTYLGFKKIPRLYPNDIWRNTSLPVIVTTVREGQESQVYGLISNIFKIFPNNTLLVYDLGLSSYTLKFLLNYCNNSRCQIQSFMFSNFPSHVTKEDTHAYRPLIIQDALQAAGAVFYIESNYRFSKHTSSDKVFALFEKLTKEPYQGVISWMMKSKNPVSSLTHKKMFEYFHTDAENFQFLPVVSADILMIVNTEFIHKEIMLPWVQCALTQDCLNPIGAQSGGCRFDKKPLYRYSGCHNYDVSALNIVLGVKSKFDYKTYTYLDTEISFNIVPLAQAIDMLRMYEQNTTTESRYSDTQL